MFTLPKTVKTSRRVGRGRSSGRGKTAGRGMSGQKSRTGESTRYFEGGQTKLSARLPKAKGFSPHGAPRILEVTTAKLEKIFTPSEKITLAELIKRLKISRSRAKTITGAKIIQKGTAKNKYKISASIKTCRALQDKFEVSPDEPSR